jgi:hypothetical protein
MTKNIFIQKVSRGGRKTCPTCKSKLNKKSIYSQGEYINAKFKLCGPDFCYYCCSEFVDSIRQYEKTSGKRVFIKCRYGTIPDHILFKRYKSFLAEELPYSKGDCYTFIENGWRFSLEVGSLYATKTARDVCITVGVKLTQLNLEKVKEKLHALEKVYYENDT